MFTLCVIGYIVLSLIITSGFIRKNSDDVGLCSIKEAFVYGFSIIPVYIMACLIMGGIGWLVIKVLIATFEVGQWIYVNMP